MVSAQKNAPNPHLASWRVHKSKFQNYMYRTVLCCPTFTQSVINLIPRCSGSSPQTSHQARGEESAPAHSQQAYSRLPYRHGGLRSDHSHAKAVNDAKLQDRSFPFPQRYCSRTIRSGTASIKCADEYWPQAY